MKDNYFKVLENDIEKEYKIIKIVIFHIYTPIIIILKC